MRSGLFMAVPQILLQRHVIAVDELVTARHAEDCCDLAALPADDTLCIRRSIGDEPATELAPVGRADNHRVAALECALDARDAGRQQALARSQRPLRARVDVDVALRLELPGDPALASRSAGRTGRGTRCTARRRPIACSGCCTLPLAITMCVPAPSAIFAASILVLMPPLRQLRAGIARHRLDLGRDRGDDVETRCALALPPGGAV